MRVLFVCLGNICRSPLAEGIFNKKIAARGLTQSFEADSCGTGSYNLGDGPDPRTVRSAFKNKVPLAHTARQLTRSDAKNFDLILAMDEYNYRAILAVADPDEHHKVKMMREYDPLGPGAVPDPYHGGENDFDQVYQILDRSIENLVSQLAVNH